jgi:ATP synthase protein I
VTAPPPKSPQDRLAGAARRAAERTRRGAEQPEPSLGARLGQMGILGWTIVVPTLIGVVIGRWIDRALGTGIVFSAALIMVGAAIGLWSAWKWMHSR